MYKLVYYGLNEASASTLGNSGIQGESRLQTHISSTTRASGICERCWVRGFVSVKYVGITQVYIQTQQLLEVHRG